MDTPHFVLRTDLGASEAKRAGLALEATRAVLVSALWPQFKFSDEKTRVYWLANGLDFERYFGRTSQCFFSPQSPATFILYGPVNRQEISRTLPRPTSYLLRHEMAHQLSAEVWPNQPRWFAEGLAEFLAPVYYAEDGQNVVVGATNLDALSEYDDVRTLGLENALNWNQADAAMPESEAAGLHGLSWLFVHWLHNQHPRELNRYLNELQRGTAADRAFTVAMQDLDFAKIDTELFAYRATLGQRKFGHFSGILRPVVDTKLSESALGEQPLAPHEVKAAQDLLAAMGKAAQSSNGDGRPPDVPRGRAPATPR